jgi:hypothetical protein
MSAAEILAQLKAAQDMKARDDLLVAYAKQEPGAKERAQLADILGSAGSGSGGYGASFSWSGKWMTVLAIEALIDAKKAAGY